MSIFDKFNSSSVEQSSNTQNVQENKVEIFTFNALPENIEQLKTLKEASLKTPFETAALTVLALCAYAADKQIGIDMLNFLRGPRPLSLMDISFLDDRFRDGKHFVPFSYFKGAVPENDYTPAVPFTLEVQSNPYSASNEGYMTLWIKSGGADSPRQITLRRKGDGRWFLWEQYIMVGIRTPKSQDPWS